MSKPIPVKLDAALLERIQKLAERVGEPQSTIMRFAMRVGLEGLEKVFETAAPGIEKLILNERHQGRTEYKLQQTEPAIMHDAPGAMEQLGRKHERQAVKKIRAASEKRTAGTAPAPGPASDATPPAQPGPDPTASSAKPDPSPAHTGTRRARTKT